jgi:hypothetical protein
MSNGIAVWSGKWKHTNWQTNGKDIWSKEEWIKMDELSQGKEIQHLSMMKRQIS